MKGWLNSDFLSKIRREVYLRWGFDRRGWLFPSLGRVVESDGTKKYETLYCPGTETAWICLLHTCGLCVGGKCCSGSHPALPQHVLQVIVWWGTQCGLTTEWGKELAVAHVGAMGEWGKKKNFWKNFVGKSYDEVKRDNPKLTCPDVATVDDFPDVRVSIPFKPVVGDVEVKRKFNSFRAALSNCTLREILQKFGEKNGYTAEQLSSSNPPAGFGQGRRP